MHISTPNWANLSLAVSKCLTIGTYCTLCARPAMPGVDLCTSCLGLFRACRYTDRNTHTTVLCPGCGLEQVEPPECAAGAKLPASGACQHDILVTSSLGHYCAGCKTMAGQFLTRIVAPYRYAYPVDRLVKRIKYREERQLTRVLGHLLAEEVLQHGADRLPSTILPMPLHPSRLRHRGFNQAADIAGWCGKHIGLTVAENQLSRIVDTGSLAGLNRQERQLRILGAFRATGDLEGKRVAIVDDVLTTGASARELAREIYDSGAESVELWVLARTSSEREGG